MTRRFRFEAGIGGYNTWVFGIADCIWYAAYRLGRYAVVFVGSSPPPPPCYVVRIYTEKLIASFVPTSVLGVAV